MKPQTPTPANEAVAVPTGEALRRLLNQAQDGDKSTLPVLRKFFENPDMVELFGGNLTKEVQARLIGKHVGKNELLRESVSRKAELLRAEILGPNSTPLERLLAEQIVICWLHLHTLEYSYARAENLTLALGEYYQRNIQRALKSYLAALKALATIRKLAIPALQVNIAKKQINVLNTAELQ